MSDDPNIIIGELAAAGIVIVLLWRYITHVRDLPRTPDPWDAETEQQLSEAKEVCPHCLTEQPPTAWFCKGCNRAIGPYNNWMPYVQIFSEGEVLRNGTTDRMRNSLLIPIGYFLISFGFVPVMFYYNSPLLNVLIFVSLLSYWSLLLKNFKRSKAKDAESSQETIQ